MAKVHLANYTTDGSGGLSASTTYYFHAADSSSLVFPRTTETDSQLTYRKAGVLSRATLHLVSNSANTSTGRIRVNAANGNQSITVTSSTTGHFSDTSNTDTVAAADKINFSLAVGSGGTNTLTGAEIIFDATTNTTTQYGATFAFGTGDDLTNYRSVPGSQARSTANEANDQVQVKTAGVWSNLFVNLHTNNISSNATVLSRIDGVDGNQTLTVTSSTTGIFEDTTHSDTVAADAKLVYKLTTAGNSGSRTGFFGSAYTTTGNTGEMMGTLNINHTLGPNNTYYNPIGGTGSDNATESRAQNLAKYAFTGKLLRVRVGANSISATSHYRLRIAGANGNQDVSISSSSTGFFSDTSGSDAIVIDNLIDYAMTAGGSGTSISHSSFGMTSEIITNLDISVSDAITVTESVVLTLINNISVNDAITVTDVPTVAIPNLGNISVNDAITVTEAITMTGQLGGISVNDAITVTESVNLSFVHSVSVNDAITVTDVPTVAIPNLGNVSVNDAITVTDVPTVAIPNLGSINVSDSITVSEAITMFMNLNVVVNDAITVTESVNVGTILGIVVNDAITVTDVPSVTLVHNISVSEAITVSESVTVTLAFDLFFGPPVGVGTEKYNSIPTTRAYN